MTKLLDIVIDKLPVVSHPFTPYPLCNQQHVPCVILLHGFTEQAND